MLKLDHERWGEPGQPWGRQGYPSRWTTQAEAERAAMCLTGSQENQTKKPPERTLLGPCSTQMWKDTVVSILMKLYIVRLKPGMFEHHGGEGHKNTLHSKNPCWVKSSQLQTENLKEMKWNLHWICTNCLLVISSQMIQYSIYLHSIYIALDIWSM